MIYYFTEGYTIRFEDLDIKEKIATKVAVYLSISWALSRVVEFLSALMGEEFILLTRGYGFMSGEPTPFDTLQMCTST